jgi:hypothetical protein
VESQNENILLLYVCPEAGRALTFCLERQGKQTYLPHGWPPSGRQEVQASPLRSSYGRARAAQKSLKNVLQR